MLALVALASATSLAESTHPRIGRVDVLPGARAVPSLRAPPQAERFAVIVDLDGRATPLINAAFGTCFPLNEAARAVRVDMCAPLAPGAPPLVFVAADADADAAALSVSDVWVLALSADEPAAVDSTLGRVLDAVDRLERAPVEDGGSLPPRRLLVLADPPPAGPPGAAAAYAEACAARLEQRLATLWRARCTSESCKVAPPVTLSVACMPRAAGVGAAAAGAHLGPPLLARFAQPGSPSYLLGAARRVPDGVALEDFSLLLETLVRRLARASQPAAAAAAAAARGSWAALLGCERARRGGLAVSEAACREIRLAQAEATHNPLPDFAPRVEAMLCEALAAYDDAVGSGAAGAESGCGGGGGGVAQDQVGRAVRAELAAELESEAAQLTHEQLEAVRLDAYAHFRSELAVLMATSGHFRWSAARLRASSLRRHGRAAAAAVPRAVRRQTAALRRAEATRLGQQMEAEVAAHEAEAAALPPRKEDVGPPPWHRQLLGQLLAIALNMAQAYLLQYLPTRRRDLADERAMPRAPLF